ncbi:Uncharacterised protein [Mycobacteroides abscessus subsp. abscessus]|nr:Uncharacterised protein [Mycobacteroides abscessus subsp. abscessus]
MAGISRVASATTREPCANSRSSVSSASGPVPVQRSRIRSGAPLTARVCRPSGPAEIADAICLT